MNGSEGTMEMSRENMNNIRKQSLTLQEKISCLVKELDEKRWVQADQSPLYGRVTKKYDIYRNNNKKNLDTLAKVRLLVQKIFFYEVNFFYSLIKLNFSLI